MEGLSCLVTTILEMRATCLGLWYTHNEIE